MSAVPVRSTEQQHHFVHTQICSVSQAEAFKKTTKTASIDGERSVESAIATVLNKLDGIYSLKEE